MDASGATLSESEEFWRDHFSSLPEDLVLVVAGSFPPGPDRGHFHSLSRRTRRLANATVTVARVADWCEAERMGTTFPQLEELRVFVCRQEHQQQARSFLQLSLPQLTRLISLELLHGSALPDEVLLVCGSLPQLQRLVLPRVPPVVLQGVAAMKQLTFLQLQVQGPSAEDLALLQQLPQLHHLDLLGCLLTDKALQALNGLQELESLALGCNSNTPVQLQPALPLLLRLTHLRAKSIPLSLGGCSFLARLAQLRGLVVSPFITIDLMAPFEDPYAGVHLLSRLQGLTQLHVEGWDMGGEGLGLLEAPSLQVLHLDRLAAAADSRPLQNCGVTHLAVESLQPSPLAGEEDAALPVLLPRVARLECSFFDQRDFELVSLYSSLTDLHIRECQSLTVTGLQALSVLPLLRRLHLSYVFLGQSEEVVDNSQVLVEGLQGCNGLLHLSLGRVPCVTDQGLQRLVAALPSLRSLAVLEGSHALTHEGCWEARNTVAQRSGGPFAWQPGYSQYC